MLRGAQLCGVLRRDVLRSVEAAFRRVGRAMDGQAATDDARRARPLHPSPAGQALEHQISFAAFFSNPESLVIGNWLGNDIY